VVTTVIFSPDGAGEVVLGPHLRPGALNWLTFHSLCVRAKWLGEPK
jgi:hypothetical protein